MPGVRRVADRCGSCREFREDFTDEDKGVTYGHCGVKPRTGAITDDAWKCPTYRPIQAVAAAPAPRADTPTMTSAPVTAPAAPVAQAAEAGVASLSMLRDDMRRMLREVAVEVMGLVPVPMADRFRGGKILIQPKNPELQAKEVDIDAFFHKIVMLRDRLRVLEAKINGSEHLDAAEKVDLQQYITRCYGSMTTFNVLFRDDRDKFVGEKTR